MRRRRNSGTWYVGKGKLIAKVNRMPKRMTIAKIRLDFQPPENLIEENVLYFVSKFRLREKIEPVLVSSQYFGEIMRIPRRSRAGDLSPVGE